MQTKRISWPKILSIVLLIKKRYFSPSRGCLYSTKSRSCHHRQVLGCTTPRIWGLLIRLPIQISKNIYLSNKFSKEKANKSTIFMWNIKPIYFSLKIYCHQIHKMEFSRTSTDDRWQTISHRQGGRLHNVHKRRPMLGKGKNWLIIIFGELGCTGSKVRQKEWIIQS